MSWVVAIDESGNTGYSSQFFTMAAIIARRANKLKKAYSIIPKNAGESKYYNTAGKITKRILQEISVSEVSIISVTVDKYDYKSRFYGEYKNRLYTMMLDSLVYEVTSRLSGSDVDIILDRSRFLSLEDLKRICQTNSTINNCNLKKCEKRSSDQSPCIQLADYVAGTIYRCYRDQD